MTAAATKGTTEREAPGVALYAEYTGRFARMISEQPDLALEEYGFVFINSIDESDATAFLKTLDLVEDGPRTRFLETVALHRRGKLDEAEKGYKALLADDKNRKEIEYNLAALQLQRGDAATARKHLAVFEKFIADQTEGGDFIDECRTRIEELRREIDEL